jgi:hypothetical protein
VTPPALELELLALETRLLRALFLCPLSCLFLLARAPNLGLARAPVGFQSCGLRLLFAAHPIVLERAELA